LEERSLKNDGILMALMGGDFLVVDFDLFEKEGERR
jgi:hypothetical protein